MQNAMSKEEMDRFLDRPRIAILGTINSDGTPHMTPVWYFTDKDKIFVTTSEGRVKAANLRRDPRATLLVANASTTKVIIAHGTAEVYEDHGAQRTRFLAELYIDDPKERKKFLDSMDLSKRLTIKITPTKTISWDFGKR